MVGRGLLGSPLPPHPAPPRGTEFQNHGPLVPEQGVGKPSEVEVRASVL